MNAAEALGGAVSYKLCGANWMGDDIRVPGAVDPPADVFQMLGARLVIALLIEMQAAVEFDRKLGLAAGVVDNVVSDDESCECRSVARQ